MGQEVPGAGAFAAVVLGLVGADRGARDFPGDGGEDEVPLQLDPRLPERLARGHEGGEAAFHVGGAEPVDGAAVDRPAQVFDRIELAAQHRVLVGAGEAGVHVAVDHQRGAAARTLEDADGVDAIGADLLGDGLEAAILEPVDDEGADLPLVPGGARDIDQLLGQARELVAGDVFEDLLFLRFGRHRCPLLSPCPAPARAASRQSTGKFRNVGTARAGPLP